VELIGLTGGIGTGKSTVAAMLRELGAIVIDADEAARAVVEPGTDAFREVVAAFGEDYVRDGRLDRAKLAQLVFSDESARRRLNEITHPRVRQWMVERQQEAEARGEERVVLEIPLLYENGLDAGLQRVIVVYVPEDVEVQRLVAGKGYREEDARARIRAQLPIAEKKTRAAFVIDNSGSRAETRAQVERVWREIAG
jgi:dephospho-CoA kinase